MERLCIIICNSLAPEVSFILQGGNYPEVTLKSFPAACVGCTLTDQRIEQIIGDKPYQYSKIVVIVSSCREKKSLSNSRLKNVEIIHLEQCFEILFPLNTIYHFISQGNYLISNGWLRKYQQHVREWGFDNDSARKFFGESIRKIVLIETGLPGDYRPNLEALSAYMGVSYEILPVGISHLQRYLDSVILGWRYENEHKIQNTRIANFARESADYSLVFNHLKNLIVHTDEKYIVEEIRNLLNLLFAPEQIVYHPFMNGIEVSSTIQYSQPYNAEDSITFEISYKHEKLGLFEVIKVRFPQFIPHYKTMELVISQIGGLAISNARRYTELERTRTALSLSEKHFRTMFEQAPLGIALINSLNGQIKDVNLKFAEIVGRSREEVRTIDWMSITHPDDVQEDLDNMARLNAGEIPGFHMNKRYFKSDGTIVWISMTIAPVEVEKDSEPLHLCMVEDITERIKAEETLRKSDERQLINNLSSGVVIHAPDTKILFANISAAEILGLTRDQLNGKEAIDKSWHFTREDKSYLPTEEYPVIKVISSQKALKNYVIGVHRPLKGDHVWVLVNAYPEFDEHDQLRQIVVSFADITRQKEVSALMAKTNLKLRKLSQSTTQMLGLISTDDIYNYLIESLHRQYPGEVVLFLKVDEENQTSNLISARGISQSILDKVRKITGIDLFNKKFKLIPELLKIFKTGSLYHFPGGLADFASTQFPSTIAKTTEKLLGIHNIYTIGITKGDKLYATIHFFNRSNEPITDNEYIELFVKQAGIVIERKQAEEQLRRNEALLKEMISTKDKFFSIISHDLRGSFASILGLTGLMSDESFDISADDLREFTQSIHKTAQSTFDLLQNLLEWSRLQKGAIACVPELIHLKKFVGNCDNATVELARKKKVELKVSIPGEIRVYADPYMLKTVLRNLVSNAIKFTPGGGTIEVSATSSDEGVVRISIKDNGIGMSMGILENLFRIDKNVSRPGTDNEPSTGLGLILCKEFVERNGGQIWAESEPGEGSTFFIQFDNN